MENLFVPFELAVKLKDIGFEDKCFAIYDEKGSFSFSVMSIKEFYTNSKEDNWNFACPLFQQAFDFFREKYNLHGDFRVNQFGYGYMYSIIDDKRAESVVYLTGGANHKMNFYEARKECLEKLIEIVANKK